MYVLFYLEERLCDEVNVTKTLTCTEGQGIVLYRAEVGGLAYGKSCGADFMATTTCRREEFYGTNMHIISIIIRCTIY